MAEKIEAAGDDAVSLLDLAVVLLRRRRIILWTTGLALLAALAYYVVRPALAGPTEPVYTLRREVVLARLPGDFADSLGLDLELLVSGYNSSASLAGDAAAASGLAPADLAPGSAGLRAWARAALLPRLSVSYATDSLGKSRPSGLGTPNGIALEYRFSGAANPELGGAFLSAFIAKVDTALRNAVAERASVVADTFQSALDSFRNGGSIPESTASLLVDSLAYQRRSVPLLIPLGEEDSIAAAKRSPVKPIVIVVLGALFLSILVAFGLESISSLRADQEARSQLRAALTKGGRSGK